MTFSRTLGSGIGVSVLGAILSNQLTDRLGSSSLGPAAAGKLADAGSNISPQVLAALPAKAVPVVKTALANSIDQLFLTGSVVLGLGFLIALTLPGLELGEEAAVDVNENSGSSTGTSASAGATGTTDADSSDD